MDPDPVRDVPADASAAERLAAMEEQRLENLQEAMRQRGPHIPNGPAPTAFRTLDLTGSIRPVDPNSGQQAAARSPLTGGSAKPTDPNRP